jgi:putative acetyltransferase
MSLTFRRAAPEDGPTLIRWLADPETCQWFPMHGAREVEDAVRIWVAYAKLGAGVTALKDGEVVGMANLYVSPYKKLMHQCLFSIVVEEKNRGQGVGRGLLLELMKVARGMFGVELLHLEVYAGNPAIFLYEKLGFVEYGRHPKFIKLPTGGYVDKVMMQKQL